jgi:predicted Rossmann fold nucleotide-binding protein DprA/Smf involved in DNA uptake
MRIGIIGSRSITDEQWVWEQIDKFLKEHVSQPCPVIITGGAKGVDSAAVRYAQHWAFNHVVFEPHHKVDPKVNYTPLFYFLRNKQIVSNLITPFNSLGNMECQ